MEGWMLDYYNQKHFDIKIIDKLDPNLSVCNLSKKHVGAANVAKCFACGLNNILQLHNTICN